MHHSRDWKRFSSGVDYSFVGNSANVNFLPLLASILNRSDIRILLQIARTGKYISARVAIAGLLVASVKCISVGVSGWFHFRISFKVHRVHGESAIEGKRKKERRAIKMGVKCAGRRVKTAKSSSRRRYVASYPRIKQHFVLFHTAAICVRQ